jgi:hypothetical protein
MLGTMKQDVLAVEYVLGLSRGDARRQIEEQMNSDAGMRSCVERWQEHFCGLDREAGQSPPKELFEIVLARIDSEGTQLPGSVTVRGEEAGWAPLSEGVSCRLLREETNTGRQSMLIRMQPGAVYQPHPHDTDEECLVVEGDLSLGNLELHAGDFHVAFKGTLHPASHTVTGCLLHISR